MVILFDDIHQINQNQKENSQGGVNMLPNKTSRGVSMLQNNLKTWLSSFSKGGSASARTAATYKLGFRGVSMLQYIHVLATIS
ncbi:hypothetical protein, partial [Gelidibacter salicanalis]|uniref:hypothetical protein n=1 Tax=Gelidibacter salicanalis TaxID=291193 RepID=UPI001F4304B6